MEVYQKSKVQLETKGAIGILTLQNPPLNLMSNTVKKELENIFITLQNDYSLRVVLITGAGNRAFCAGADLKEFPERIQQNSSGCTWDQGHERVDLVNKLPQILIAVINGIALGGGLELALACDIIFASKEVKLGLPEVKIGIMPGSAGIENLLERVGYSTALELLITGKILDAREAMELGIIDYLIENKPAINVAVELANIIISSPIQAVKAIKETLITYKKHSREEARIKGREHFIALHQTQNCLEGLDAFFKKREPKFNKN